MASIERKLSENSLFLLTQPNPKDQTDQTELIDLTQKYVNQNIFPAEQQKHNVILRILETIRKIANEILNPPIENKIGFIGITLKNEGQTFSFETIVNSSDSYIKGTTREIHRTDSEVRFDDILLLYEKVQVLRDASNTVEKAEKRSFFSSKYCLFLSAFISVYAALMIGKVLSTKKG